MVDKEILTFVKRELDGLTKYVSAVDKRVDGVDQKYITCREHCDRARESCSIKEDHEKRLRLMEKRQEECERQVAINTASSWKGAKLIGACTLTAGLTTAVITLLRWFIK